MKRKLYISIIVAIILSINYFNFAQTITGSIKGIVIDKATKEPLLGANIVLLGTTLGAAANEFGEFSINNIEVGPYNLRGSVIGYNALVKTDIIVNSTKPIFVKFELSSSVIELEGVTVKSDFFDSNPTEVNSVKKFSYEEIRRSPGGFEDVVRALSILPGVAQQSAGRNDLVVRGGAPSENLYIVDGYVVPNINHFGSQGATGGPLSYINLDYVEETTFSTGGFSAVYGDKLSSVLKIDLLEGTRDKIGGKALISASQFGFNLDGPVDNNSDFIFSIRRSYLDFIFNAAGFSFVPEYYDLLSKFSYNLSNYAKLSFLFIGALDRVNFNNNDESDIFDNARILGSNQNQYLTGLSYRHLFDNGFYTISFSRNFVKYDTFQKDTLLNPIFVNNSIEAENELKADLVYKLSTNSELNIGTNAKLIKYNSDILFPENFITSFGDTLPFNNIIAREQFWKLGSYVQYSSILFDRLRINLGSRIDYFNGINRKFYISPRTSFSYMMNESFKINFSTGLYYQSPSYIWLAAVESNKDLNAIQVQQFILGVEQLLREDTRLKVEAFYKLYNDYPASLIRRYLVLANTGSGFGGSTDNFSSLGLEPLVREGEGDVRGIEISIQKKSSRIPHYGLFSLTYSEAYFTALDGVRRPGIYDQKWILNLTAGYMIDEEWEASLKFRFATGSPYTPFNIDGTQSVQNYNTKRYTSQHSLDLRIDRRWYLGNLTLITYIDIQNIYNRKNNSSIRWDYEKRKVDYESSIGILPSIGMSLEF